MLVPAFHFLKPLLLPLELWRVSKVVLTIFRSILQRCHSNLALENAAEIWNVVESAFVTYLLDGQRRVAEQMAGDRQAVLIETGDNGFACMVFEKGAKCRAVHAHMPGKVINGNIAFVIAADEDFYLFQTALCIRLS